MELSMVLAILAAVLLLLAAAGGGLLFGRRLGRLEAQALTPDLASSIAPVESGVQRLEQLLRAAETRRASAHGELREQVRAMHALQGELGTQTTTLINALRAPHVRGRWGEMQLRRIVESSGMIDHCDFSEQASTRAGSALARPDLVIHLTAGRSVVVDAKVPFTAFIEAIECTDDSAINVKQRAHARQVRAHMDLLSGKAYQDVLADTPEFVVMFLPSDSFLQLALKHDPALLEYGFERNVVIATPSSLLALLRTVAHTWRQDTATREAAEILQLGQQLHSRLGVFLGHVCKMGAALNTVVSRYNQSVGSLERNVLPAAARMQQAGVATHALQSPEPIVAAVREATAASDR